MPYQTLYVTESEKIVTVTLNRPERRNALNPQMIDELIQVIESMARRSCGVMVLTGRGTAFCAGLDLEHLKSLVNKSAAEHREDSERVARLFRSLYDLPLPTIAAVNGHAIAGGMGLATICDFTLSVPEAKFGYTEARIGFVPAMVSAFLALQVGEKQARDLLLTARLLTAEQALHLGLVNEVVNDSALFAHTRQLAHHLLQNSPESLRATKKLLSEHTREQLDRQLKAAIESNANARSTGDFKEGVSSFLEKEKPELACSRQGESVTHEGVAHDRRNAAICQTRVRVRYAETDQMGVVYYSNYLIWFELGRVELLRELGFEYKRMEIEDECFIPVVEANCRYKAPARYDEELTIHTEVAHLRTSVLKFRYRVVRTADSTLLAEGETVHVITDGKMQKRALPEKYVERLRTLRG